MAKTSIYELNGTVPVAQAIPFGLQHVLAMFVSNITPIIILAGIVGVDSALQGALIQNCMIIAGIGTLIQLYPLWRIGSRLPIVMGISFTFLTISIAIATSQGMGTLMVIGVLMPVSPSRLTTSNTLSDGIWSITVPFSSAATSSSDFEFFSISCL